MPARQILGRARRGAGADDPLRWCVCMSVRPAGALVLASMSWAEKGDGSVGVKSADECINVARRDVEDEWICSLPASEDRPDRVCVWGVWPMSFAGIVVARRIKRWMLSDPRRSARWGAL